ncbi:hypothetical protein GWI33_018044 [Rhynchophorus ferrugineus]|uniref:Uncharacterized protein n=1 Tax=Rhynchophorus ferrugineus TaxID=354439 RepID=A0A834M5P4_RHYFE|nr:hypothetical protein GWI33_018044 [Rhynchophorus ferrugineus]
MQRHECHRFIKKVSWRSRFGPNNRRRGRSSTPPRKLAALRLSSLATAVRQTYRHTKFDSDTRQPVGVACVRTEIKPPSYRESNEEVVMGPLHKLQSFFSASVVDINNNSSAGAKMGFKGKTKRHFGSEIDFFVQGERIKTKTYVWSSIKTPKRSKGTEF